MPRKTTKKVNDGKVPTFYRIKLNIFEDILGAAPADPDVYTKFIAAKAFGQEKLLAQTQKEKAAIALKEQELIREELALLPADTGKAITVFRRDSNGLVVTDTMVRGFLKEGAAAIGIDGSDWGLSQKIGRFVFITNEAKRPLRTLPILRDGQQVKEPDGVYERPLRAMTRQGPRITLLSSELVKAPVSLEFYIYVVGLGISEKSNRPITPVALKSWLAYGAFTGLGQYRSGGHGRFDAEIEVIG